MLRRTIRHMDIDTRTRNAAIVLACVRARPRSVSVAAVITNLLASDDPAHALQDATGTGDALFGDGRFTEILREAQGWAAAGLTWVSVLDADYPTTLLGVHDAPPVLFYRGSLDAFSAGGVSIVGTRNVSPAGQARARDAAQHLAASNVPVISGLAKGVDTVAHTSALDSCATPVGVIATPITGPYTPAPNRGLHELVAERGALVSQFLPTDRVAKHSFVQRNATMSGLGFATIIIEAGEHSGTRSQARFAQAHGRPVILAERVVAETTWGRELADSGSANVLVVTSRDDMHRAIEHVVSIARFDAHAFIESQFV